MDGEDWESFWELATPEKAAEFLVKDYGIAAAGAAASCAAMARHDGREDDCGFWLAVLDIVDHSTDGAPPEPTPAELAAPDLVGDGFWVALTRPEDATLGYEVQVSASFPPLWRHRCRASMEGARKGQGG